MNTEYETINENVVNWKTFMRQLAVNSVSSVFDILVGVGTGAPTVIIPQLRKNANTTESITDDMASWASSANQFSGVSWVIILTTMAHFLGRKKTMMFLNVSFILIFTSVYFSSNIKWVIINQILFGIGNASIKTILIMIITEFSSPKHRGVFLTFKVASFYWGIWISNALGTYFHFSSIGLFGIICNIYIFIALFKVPESPQWLAKNGKYDQCASSHRWLKGVDDDAEKELDVLLSVEKENRKSMKSNNIKCQEFKSLMKPEIFKPILCCILLHLLYELSGKIILAIYAIDIFKKISGSEQRAYTLMLIIDGATVFGMYLASGLTKITTRMKLLISASLIALLFLFLLSLYLYLVKLSIASENIYVTVSLLIAYSICICCGPIIVCSLFIGELLPVKNSVAVVICTLCMKIITGTFVKVAPSLFRYLGNHGAFASLGFGVAISLFIVYRCVPETKNKTLNEIAEFFKPKTIYVDKELESIKQDNNVDTG